MAPGQPPGEKCSPDTDNIQFLPCEMQKSTLTSAKLFYHPVSDPASLIVLLHTLTRKHPLPRNQICAKKKKEDPDNCSCFTPHKHLQSTEQVWHSCCLVVMI